MPKTKQLGRKTRASTRNLPITATVPSEAVGSRQWTPAERLRFYELAQQHAYLKHKKDRQDVLERHYSEAKQTYRACRGNGAESKRVRLLGWVDGLKKLRDEREERSMRLKGKSAEQVEAGLRKRRQEYAKVRRDIADMEEEMEHLLSGIEEEPDITSEEEEELSGSDHTPPPPPDRRSPGAGGSGMSVAIVI